MEECASAAPEECQTRPDDDSGSKLQENGEAMATGVDPVKDCEPAPVEAVPSAIEASLDRLLQRQRSELFFELRRLQYGDRPVTGQEEIRRTVENLVLRAVGPTRGQGDATGRRQLNTVDRFSTSAGETEVHRPEEIIVEVNALVERRPVSSILQSLAFRRSLENSVRGALQTIRNGSASHPPASRVTTRETNDSSSSSERGAVAGSSHGSTDRERSPSSLSLRSINDLTASAAATEAADDVRVLHPLPVPVQTLDNVAGESRAGEWIQQHVPLHADPVDGHQMRVRDILDQMHHEEFIVEISDLIHRQLVTSSLNGNFRNVLERRLRRHMDDSGINGARVAEQLRRLPRSNVHLRNDFLDLGIIAPTQAAGAGAADDMAAADQLDNMSVISATAAVALPQAYTQSNVAMSREILSLKTELQELKNMMRLSFDLQLDIQRSIKQEVSAALAQRPDGASVSTTMRQTTVIGARVAESDGQCLICLERPVDTALYQCGHLCLCNLCALQLRQNGAHCPVCRAPIRDIMRTYRP